MRKLLYSMLVTATVGLAACGGSAENNDAASDSTINDTATFDTSSRDSLNMVDSAVHESDKTTVDSGSTTKHAP